MQPSFSAVPFPEARGEVKLNKAMDVERVHSCFLHRELFLNSFRMILPSFCNFQPMACTELKMI